MDRIGTAGNSKTATRILIFSIAIGAHYSYGVKNSKIWAPAFFKHNNLIIATVAVYLHVANEHLSYTLLDRAGPYEYICSTYCSIILEGQIV